MEQNNDTIARLSKENVELLEQKKLLTIELKKEIVKNKEFINKLSSLER